MLKVSPWIDRSFQFDSPRWMYSNLVDVAMAANANGFQAALGNCSVVGMAGPALIESRGCPGRRPLYHQCWRMTKTHRCLLGRGRLGLVRPLST